MPLAADAVVVGSDPQAHVPIRADLGLAPRHYELRPLFDGGHQVISLIPEAPVLVNDQPVPSAMLLDGDVITAGSLRLMYRNDSAALQPAKPAPSPSAGPPPLPAFSAPPPLPPITLESLSPPQLAATAALPMTGYRLPGALQVPEDEENLEGFSEAVKQKKRAEKLMRESLQRTQNRMQELKVEQNFSLGLLTALLALALGGFAYMQISHMTWKLWLPLTGAVGLGVGWIIRLGGKGIDRRFGVLAAITAMLSIAAANLTNYEIRIAEYKASEMGEAEDSEYAQETAQEKAERLAREEQTRREDEQREALFEAQFREERVQLEKQVEAMATNLSKEERAQLEAELTDEEMNELETTDEELAAEEAALREEEKWQAEYDAAENTEAMGINLFAFLWLLFNPKSLVGYFVIAGAAYRAAFRYLSNAEASNLHLGGERAEDLSGKSIRERIQMGQAAY